MCGVVGVIGEKHAAQEIHRALFALQHRGQDAAGILSYDFIEKTFHLDKDAGLVADVFDKESIENLKGQMAIGHTRYSTLGSTNKSEVQPFLTNFPYGIGMVHNGNLVNYEETKEELRNDLCRWTLTKSDLEILLNFLSHNLSTQANKGTDLFQIFSSSYKKLYEQVKGAYSVVGMIAEKGMFAFTDPNGIRPLMLGTKVIQTEKGEQKAYCLTSEKQVFNYLGYSFERDLEPGEFVLIYDGKIQTTRGFAENARPCMFEWVYFASAESAWHGRSVYEVRLNLGKELAQSVRSAINMGHLQPDIVAPIPDTSRTAAVSLAEELGIPYREVLIKNRYIQRSFILNETKRDKAVDLKLGLVESEIKGKKILLVDDSIVRGTTAKKIILLLKNAGAAAVYLASTCPPVRYPCFYGIDFPDSNELVAHNKTVSDIESRLGADAVIYLPLLALKRAIGLNQLCSACLDGNYPVKVDQEKYMQSRLSNLKEGVRV